MHTFAVPPTCSILDQLPLIQKQSNNSVVLCLVLHRQQLVRRRPFTDHSPKSAGGRLQLNRHTPYVCGFAWLHGVHITCAETAAVSCGTNHASAVSTPLRWIFKNALYIKNTKTKQKTTLKKEASHSRRITYKLGESARERRIALYKSSHHHPHQKQTNKQKPPPPNKPTNQTNQPTNQPNKQTNPQLSLSVH